MPRLYDGSESKRSHEGDGTQATLLVLDEGNEQLVTATMHIVQQYATSNDAITADTTLVEYRRFRRQCHGIDSQ